jgi:hypothetical protein
MRNLKGTRIRMGRQDLGEVLKKGGVPKVKKNTSFVLRDRQ